MIERLLEADRLLALGLKDQAERIYWQAVELDPQNAIAVVGLARVASERGDDRTALEFARKALKIDPESPAASRLAARFEEILVARGETVTHVDVEIFPPAPPITLETLPAPEAKAAAEMVPTAEAVPEPPAAEVVPTAEAVPEPPAVEVVPTAEAVPEPPAAEMVPTAEAVPEPPAAEVEVEAVPDEPAAEAVRGSGSVRDGAAAGPPASAPAPPPAPPSLTTPRPRPASKPPSLLHRLLRGR